MVYNNAGAKAEQQLQKLCNNSIEMNIPIDINEVIQIIVQWLRPDEVFDIGELESWAEDNGFSKD